MLECRRESPQHIRKLKNECVRSRTRRRVVAPAGGSAMPSSHWGLELRTRACGPRSLLLESRSGVSAAVLPSTNPQLKYTAMSWLWSSVHSTLIAVQQTAHSAVVDGTTRGRKTHRWKKRRTKEEEEGENEGKVRKLKSHNSKTFTPSTLINMSLQQTVCPDLDHTQDRTVEKQD